MLLEPAIENPRQILYNQVERILVLRINGSSAFEAINGLKTMIEPYKDSQYTKDLEDRPEDLDVKEMFWHQFECIIKLLSRNRLWASPPRIAKEGKELIEAI
jgi:hypothetical protein